MNYAVIENDKVVNIIVAQSKEIAEEVVGLECVECDGSFGVQWTRSGNTWNPPTE